MSHIPRLSFMGLTNSMFPLNSYTPVHNSNLYDMSGWIQYLCEMVSIGTSPLSQDPKVIYHAERNNLTEMYTTHFIRYCYNDITKGLSNIDPFSYATDIVEHTRPKQKNMHMQGETLMVGNNKIEKIVDEVSESILQYWKNSIKHHFGKEFDFPSREAYVTNQITNRFIKKYDKKFKQHTVVQYHGMKNVIVNNQFFVRLDNHTFMYVAAGNKIGDIQERFMVSLEPSSDDLYIYIFGKYYNKYVRELNTLIKKITNVSALGIYIIDVDKNTHERREKSESIDVMYNKMQNRDLDTLFFSHGEKESICNHINKFNNNEKFYKEKQLLYKTGILLHGEPGTGKSSLVKAIATKYSRSIVAVNMSNIEFIDLNKLTQAINIDEDKKYIVLLEDIDTLFLDRSNGQISNADQAVINKLLQFLDSNTSPTNVIFIATTNHIDRLDSALLREGRFDLKVEVKPLSRDEAILFGKSFGLSIGTMESVLKDLDEEFSDLKGVYNQSRLQTRILGKLENKSVEIIKNIHGEMEE